MEYKKLLDKMNSLLETSDFQGVSEFFENFIFNLSKDKFLPILRQIGSIPEYIYHDSTAEKLYAKISDIVLAKCYRELNLNSQVIKSRANCADVIAKSDFHNYSLVSDAKVFRLSRTAKNQKDFKVESMAHWRGDCDYSVLCCPMFQYPKKTSQIYTSAIVNNISLFTWEYFYILIKNDIKENENLSLENLWNCSSIISKCINASDINLCFIEKQNDLIIKSVNIDNETFENFISNCKNSLKLRAVEEISYWKNRIEEVKNYTKEEAIELLIKTLKINEKIKSINDYIKKCGC